MLPSEDGDLETQGPGGGLESLVEESSWQTPCVLFHVL